MQEEMKVMKIRISKIEEEAENAEWLSEKMVESIYDELKQLHTNMATAEREMQPTRKSIAKVKLVSFV